MEIINLNQRSDDWHAWRKKGVSASQMPTIMRLSPYETPWSLWAIRTGRLDPPDLSNNPHVQRGIQLEDEARQMLEERLDDEKRKSFFMNEAKQALEHHIGEMLIPVCAEYSDWRPLRASYDGLTDSTIPAELKCPSQRIWDEVKEQQHNSKTVQMHLVQLETQMVVADAKEGYLAFYNPLESGDKKLIVFKHVLTDMKKIKIVDTAKEFWALIQSETPPAVDPERDIFVPTDPMTYARWQSFASEYKQAMSQLDALYPELSELKSTMDNAKTKLVAMLGDFKKGNCDDLLVTTYDVKGKIDYPKFLSDTFSGKYTDDDLENFRKSSSTQSRVTVTKKQSVDPESVGAKANADNHWF